MGVRIAAGVELEGNDADKEGRDGSRPGVPLPKEACDSLVELPHDVLEDAVEHEGPDCRPKYLPR